MAEIQETNNYSENEIQVLKQCESAPVCISGQLPCAGCITWSTKL